MFFVTETPFIKVSLLPSLTQMRNVNMETSMMQNKVYYLLRVQILVSIILER